MNNKQRPRRIAADEAHAWARNLRLNNPFAKLTLCMLTLYVDGDGTCWVGIPSLAHDTELSPATIRNRLGVLEEAGAVVRMPQWIDEYGRRNSDARGRRTSDLIRLLIDDEEGVESRAAQIARDKRRKSDPSWQEGSTSEADPSPQEGSTTARHSADPSPTLRRPYDSAKGLISEPEPESEPEHSPPSPSGGESERDSIGSDEPVHFAPAWQGWIGHEIGRRDLALAEFRALSPEKQVLCRAAVPLFSAMWKSAGRTVDPMGFHLWIRKAGFEEFPNATLAPAAGGPSSMVVPVNSAEGRAVAALYRMARVSLFENRGQFVYPLEVTPQVLAFADAGPHTAWPWIEDRQQIAAWSAFVAAHVHRPGPFLQTRGLGADQRSGIYAPWPWPPRKDGTISAEEKPGDAA